MSANEEHVALAFTLLSATLYALGYSQITLREVDILNVNEMSLLTETTAEGLRLTLLTEAEVATRAALTGKLPKDLTLRYQA